MKSILRFIADQFSIARLMLFIIAVGLGSAIFMSIASQQIDDELRLRPPPESDFKPVLPKGYKPQREQ